MRARMKDEGGRMKKSEITVSRLYNETRGRMILTK
jgi:hypothetical protein